MSGKVVISALARKYAKLAYELRELDGQITEAEAVISQLETLRAKAAPIREAMAAIQTSVRLYDSGWDPTKITPVRTNSRLPVAQGHYMKTALRIVGRAKHKMTAREIAILVVADLGLGDKANVESVISNVNTGLSKLEGRLIEVDRTTTPRRFSVLPRDRLRPLSGASTLSIPAIRAGGLRR
jgi:hypothetical protein